MVKKLVGVVVIGALLLLLAACAGPPGAQGPPGEPGLPGLPGLQGPPGGPAEQVASIVITPMSGKMKAAVTFYGAGFQPDEEVLLILTAEGVVKGESVGDAIWGFAAKGAAEKDASGIVVANKYGAFKLTRNLPVKIGPGTYTLEARGDKGSRATHPLEIIE